MACGQFVQCIHSACVWNAGIVQPVPFVWHLNMWLCHTLNIEVVNMLHRVCAYCNCTAWRSAAGAVADNNSALAGTVCQPDFDCFLSFRCWSSQPEACLHVVLQHCCHSVCSVGISKTWFTCVCISLCHNAGNNATKILQLKPKLSYKFIQVVLEA